MKHLFTLRFRSCVRPAAFLAFLFFLLLAGAHTRAQISTTTVTVNDTSITPTSVTATATVLCNGGSSTLTVQGGELGDGADWIWYAGGCGTGGSIDTGTSITVTPTATTTYYVRAEGGACNYITGCASVTITVNPVPTVTVPPDQVFCFGETTTPLALTGTPAGVTFDIAGGTAVGLANQTGVTQVPSFTATNPGTAPLTATITVTPNANGCAGTPQTFQITVLPQVTVTPTADIVVCNGQPVNVPAFAGSPAGNVYNWANNAPNIGLGASGTGNIPTFNAINTSCGDSVATIIVTPQFTASGETCPGTADTFAITVHPSPNGTIAGDTICEGQPAQLLFTATCGTGPFDLEIQTNTNPPPYAPYNGVTSGTPFNLVPPPTTTTNYNLMKITDANGCIRQ